MREKSEKEEMQKLIAFLRIKIKGGTKQNQIAKFLNRSPSYVNHLYLKNPKSCPLEIKEKIAAFFGISLDELLHQGEKYLTNYDDYKLLLNLENETEPFIEKRSTSTSNLLRQIDFFRTATLKNSQKCENLERSLNEAKKTLRFFKASFNEIHQGITFFDTSNNLAFSTNRWNLLPTLSESKNRSLDAMIISLADKVQDYDKLIDVAKNYQLKKEKIIITLNFIGKGAFKFTIIPVFEDHTFIGTAVINSPADKPIFSDSSEEIQHECKNKK